MAGFQMSFDEVHRCLYYPDQGVGGERTKHPLLNSEEIEENRRLGNALSPNEATLHGAKLSPAYVAYQFEGRQLVKTTVRRLWDGQKFVPSATPWELERSVLAAHIPSLGGPDLPVRPAGRLFSPVVAPSPLFAQVVGHVGAVNGIDLIAPTRLAAGSVKAVFARGMLFVAAEENQSRPPDGWTQVGFSSHSYVVLTTPDGQVINILGVTNRDAVINVIDEAIEKAEKLLKNVAEWVYENRWEIALGILIPELMPVALRLALRGRQMLRSLVGRLRSGAQVRGLLAGATPELAASAPALTAVEASGLNFEVLARGPTIPGTSVPQSLTLRVGTRRFNISRNPVKLEPSGKPIGPATKHLAETLKGEGGTWNDQIWKGRKILHSTRSSNVWLQQTQADFPMSSLASGLQAAEREVLSGRLAPMVSRQTGLPMLGVYEVQVEGWEFMINTNENPWKVYHLVVR
jgi:hypothetical protein